MPFLHFKISQALHEQGVENKWIHLIKTNQIGIPMVDASDEDFGEEYNDMIISIGVVSDMKSAIELINTKGQLIPIVLSRKMLKTPKIF